MVIVTIGFWEWGAAVVAFTAVGVAFGGLLLRFVTWTTDRPARVRQGEDLNSWMEGRSADSSAPERQLGAEPDLPGRVRGGHGGVTSAACSLEPTSRSGVRETSR